MYSRTVTIVNESGLHARPASDFIKAASGFKSRINIKRTGSPKSVNAKSIVSLLTLGLEKGAEVELSAEGEDETQAVDFLFDLIESGLSE